MDDDDWVDLADLADPDELERVRAELGDAVTEFDLRWERLRQVHDDPEQAERYAERVLHLLNSWLHTWPNGRRTRFSGPPVHGHEHLADRPPLSAHVLDLLFSAQPPPDHGHDTADESPTDQADADRGPTGPEAVAVLQHKAKTWLLSTPAWDAATLNTYYVDPWQEHLIRLPAPDGSTRLPSFQFDADGRPLAVVLEINALFGSNDDPWGVAGWWLGSSLWFPKAPAQMIGSVPDERLLVAAHAALDGEW